MTFQLSNCLSSSKERRCEAAVRGPVLGALASLVCIPLLVLIGMPGEDVLPLSILFGLAAHCLLPLLILKDEDAFRPKILVAIYFVVYFGLRATYLATNENALRIGFLYYQDYVPRALWCADLGFFAFLIGYEFFDTARHFSARAPGRKLRWPKTFPSVKVAVLLLIGFASAMYLFSLGAVVGNLNLLPRDSPVPGTPVLLSNLIKVAWIAIWIGIFSNKSQKSLWPLLAASLLVLVVKTAYEGGKQSFLEPAVEVIIVFHYLKRKLTVTKLLAVGLPCLYLAFGLINTYRFIIVGKVGGVPKSISDVRDRVQMAIDYYASGDSDPTQKSAFAQMMDRQNGVDALAVSMRYTPERRAFGWGRPYLQIPVQLFIPRQIWKDKPVYEPTDDFERDYLGFPPGVVGFSSIHLISDFYQNFSYAGVFLGFLAVGAVLSWCYRFCMPFPENHTGVFLCAFLMPGMVHLLEFEAVGLVEQLLRWVLLLVCVCAFIGVTDTLSDSKTAEEGRTFLRLRRGSSLDLSASEMEQSPREGIRLR